MNPVLPKGAGAYVLYQRTSLIRSRQSGLAKKLARFGLARTYEQMVEDEAVRRHDEIEKLYFAEMLQVFDAMKDHIPATCRSVLDIGCGIAGLDVFIYRHLQHNQPHMNLLDRTRVEDKVWYKYAASGAFYNSLELARDTLVANGVPADAINLIEAPADGRIQGLSDIDLVVSTISWGFHYPVGVYLDSVHDLLAENGSLILDVRKDTDGLDALRGKFAVVDVIGDFPKYQTLRCSKQAG